MIKWVEKIKQSRENLTASTLKTYQTRLKKLLKVTKKKDPTFLKSMGAEQVIKILNENDLSQSMKTNILTIILVLGSIMKLDEEKLKIYKEEKVKYQVKYFTKQQEQKKDIKENENWVSVKELKKIPNYWKRQFEKSTKDKKINSLKWLVSSLYITANYLPPERGNIYIKMKYTKTKPDDDKFNYFLDGEKKELILNNFKTVKALGKKIFKIPKNSKILKALNAYRLYNNTNYLLINPINNEPFTSPRFTEFLQLVFEPTGKKVSSVLLRKIYISDFYKDDKSIKTRKKIASKMLHSSNVAQSIYEKK